MNYLQYLLLVSVLLIAPNVYAETGNLSPSGVQYGIEADVSPFLLGGYYISGWIAKDHFKVRAINTKLDVPDFATKDGFEDNRLTSFALLLDYFPNSDLTGWWIGGGPVYWAGSIRNSSDKEQADYKTWSATIGTGYVWDLSGHFYIMPWAAIIVPVAGDRKFDVGNETYEHSGIVPEASVKIGWKF